MEEGERELFRMFLEDARRYPLLSPREEREAALGARAGDPEARDRLVESNLRFVAKKVNDWWRPGLPRMDMVSEACMGLVHAARLYDPAEGVRFLSYAGTAVERGIIKAIAGHRRLCTIPLDEMVFPDDRSEAFVDRLPAAEPYADDVCFQGEIRELLAHLNAREREVIELRFWRGMTLEETGEAMGVQKKRARQIEMRALQNMRWSLYEDIGSPEGRKEEDLFAAARQEILCG
jgi:RNA polymerase primary sigma factor